MLFFRSAIAPLICTDAMDGCNEWMLKRLYLENYRNVIGLLKFRNKKGVLVWLYKMRYYQNIFHYKLAGAVL